MAFSFFLASDKGVADRERERESKSRERKIGGSGSDIPRPRDILFRFNITMNRYVELPRRSLNWNRNFEWKLEWKFVTCSFHFWCSELSRVLDGLNTILCDTEVYVWLNIHYPGTERLRRILISLLGLHFSVSSNGHWILLLWYWKLVLVNYNFHIQRIFMVSMYFTNVPSYSVNMLLRNNTFIGRIGIKFLERFHI